MIFGRFSLIFPRLFELDPRKSRISCFSPPPKAHAGLPRVLRRFEFSALLACRLETGRTHQIRVHLTSIGHPVIGDPQYGKSPLKQLSGITTELSQTLTNFKRQALHAEILGFEHPVSGEWLEFKAPFPDDYKILLKAIQHD